MLRLPLLALVAILAGCAAPGLTPAGAPADGGSLPLAAPVVLPLARGAYEPSIAVDASGNVLVQATSPFTAAPVWVSHDAGATFRALDLSATSPPSDLPAGIEGQVAFSPDGSAYSVDDNAGTLVLAGSRDGGESWEMRTPLALAVPVGDRPWVAAGAGGRVYVTWNQLPSSWWIAASADGGTTFPVQTFLGSVDPNFPVTGVPIVATDGTLYLARGEPEGPALYASHDGARTFERHLAWRSSGAIGWLFTTPAVDARGTVYVTTIEQGPEATRAMYASSRDGGQTWSAPHPVTQAPGVHVHAWSAAGPAGRLAVALYENPTGRGVPDHARGSWWPRLVVLDDADTDHPRARESRLTQAPVHEGAVCTGGTTACSAFCAPVAGCPLRDPDAPAKLLGDYLGVAMDRVGIAHVAFQDTTKDMKVLAIRSLS